MEVPLHILRSFGLTGPQTLLPGGQNRSFLADGYVLKPADNPTLTEWASAVWSNLEPAKYRISRPLKTKDGRFTQEGWSASRFEKGHHARGRLAEKLAVCTALHADLAGLALDEMPENNDPWARAHRVAWQIDELPSCFPVEAAATIHRILSRIEPGNKSFPGIIHGDLAGNILFEEGELPLIIDFSPFKAPAAYGEAILVCDSIAWENSPLTSLSLLPGTLFYKDMLARAVLFRLTAAGILNGEAGFVRELSQFGHVLVAIHLLEDG